MSPESRREWGVFVDSFPTKREAEEFIQDSIRAMRVMGFEVGANAFSIHPTYDNTKGRKWYSAVYMREDRVTKIR